MDEKSSEVKGVKGGAFFLRGKGCYHSHIEDVVGS